MPLLSYLIMCLPNEKNMPLQRLGGSKT
jgi:hypothetical protein